MKKIIFLSVCLFPLFTFFSCENKEDLVFEHEKPQFEIKSNAILLELIVPVETTTTEEIYVIGDFNGGTAAAGKPEWKLQRSENTNYRWGVYLDPATFINGKTLADGYYFTSLQNGYETTLAGEKVMRSETVNIGTRLEGKITRWESYFHSPDSWPIVPANKIMLQVTVPDYTPENSKIAVYGNLNGWDGSTAKWQAKMLSPTRYYFLLDPAEFAAGADLTQEFKLALLQPKQEWWYHQANANGGPDDGAGMSIAAGTVTGEAHALSVAAWRNKDEIGIAPPEPMTIYFKQVVGDWTAFAVYAWGEGVSDTDLFGSWPGTKLTANSEGWYAIVVPDARPIHMILNNYGEGAQFDFLNDPTESAWYEINTTEGTWTAVDAPGDVYTIRWKQANPVWAEMAIYSWGGSPVGDVFGSWPGKTVTPDADGWYSVTIPLGQTSGNIIFNNNNNGIQIEPGPTGLTESACFIIDTEALSWSAADCD